MSESFEPVKVTRLESSPQEDQLALLTESGFEKASLEGREDYLYQSMMPKESLFEKHGIIWEFDPSFNGLARFRGRIGDGVDSESFAVDIQGIDENGYKIKVEHDGTIPNIESIVKELLLRSFLGHDANPTEKHDISNAHGTSFTRSDKKYSGGFQRANVISKVIPSEESGGRPKVISSPEQPLVLELV
jgi:hypothetical protein